MAAAETPDARPVLEEVIVTAEKRSENIQDVPASVPFAGDDQRRVQSGRRERRSQLPNADGIVCQQDRVHAAAVHNDTAADAGLENQLLAAACDYCGWGYFSIPLSMLVTPEPPALPM